VEDEAVQREMYARYLAAAGLRVLTCGDGLRAVELTVRHRPDIVVMDLALPRLDGWEATGRIKADPRTARIPVVACTAHVLGGAPERAIEAGCDGYLVKPCLPDDLLNEVRRMLLRRGRR
jgi:two-component system cell cycle response regulator DivK